MGLTALAALGFNMATPIARADPLVRYEIKDNAIAAPLGGLAGDAARGRTIIEARKSACLLCHAGPFPEQRFPGTIGPDLRGVGARLTAGQMRLRLVDATRLNPDTVMPPYYRVDGLTRVAQAQRGKPILTAQEIEDVIAFLATLQK
jgi:sulfur-oxidizing protein SoxX